MPNPAAHPKENGDDKPTLKNIIYYQPILIAKEHKDNPPILKNIMGNHPTLKNIMDNQPILKNINPSSYSE